MNRLKKQFSLLIVRGDGLRVVRFNFPRPAAFLAFVLLAVVVSATGALLSDWLQLRRLTREAVTFAGQIEEQKRTIDSLNRRVADIRKDVTGWQELHARIWEPFGPELRPGGRDKGIGGAALPDRPPVRPTPGDELNRLAEIVAQEGESLRALDRLMARAGKALAALPSRWPVRGPVNSEYGHRQSPWVSVTEYHSGIDIRAERGTQVKAPAGGTVSFSGTQPEYGVTVILDHGNDVRTLYGHLSKAAVEPGQKVERGGLIGYSGNTGRTSGPHLHYEIIVRGAPVNPRAYLWD
ncbi:MAG: M23 family metallopeptidase [Candidatus Rokuibacteriota bacterium]